MGWAGRPPDSRRDAGSTLSDLLLMTFPRYLGAAGADQKIEIRPLVRLQDVIDVEPLISAGCNRRRRRPRFSSAGQFVVRHTEVQLARFHVQFDFIAIPHQRQRSARADSGATCNTTVPYAVPLMRASETRTTSVISRCSNFCGIGIFPTSGIPG